MKNIKEYHIPVMAHEVGEHLVWDDNGLYVDCTFGGGGHSLYMLENYSQINMVALDCDADAIEKNQHKIDRYNDRIQLCKSNFSEIKKVLFSKGINEVDGIFADLGVSSFQLDELTRGFSFKSENLDMRMDKDLRNSAYDVLNTFAEDELADIFYVFGEEYMSRRIANQIVRHRNDSPIKTAGELTDILTSVKKRKGKINPATKVFQALRIYVNNELENLKILLDSSIELLRKNGRIVILSYHSLEDRIVKHKFKQFSAKGNLEIITKKVVFPSHSEIKMNPRARSAKLRSAFKLSAPLYAE